MKTVYKTIIFAMAAICLSLFIATQSFPVTAYAEGKAAKNDKSLVTTYKTENSVVNAPTVVVDGVDKATLDKVTDGKEKPSNVILRVDKDLNVVGANGEVIDTFSNIFTKLDKKVIPVLSVSTEEEADAVITYLTNDTYVLDTAVLSSDAKLVGKIKTARPNVRGIVAFDGSVTKEDIVATANENQASVVILNEGDLNNDDVYYVQGRFKTVWMVAKNDDVSLYDAVFSGAYGVICTDAKRVYDFYKTLPENTYVRSPYIVAHRGDPTNCNENSLSGIAYAAEHGATHVELDFHVTKDKEIICMHNDSIKATTSYTGSDKISTMTLKEIQRYKINNKTGATPEIVPTLEDCVREILKTDMIFVLELKCNDKNIVGIINEKLTADEELSQILDRMVVISFYRDRLADMKTIMPKIPTADLNDVSRDDFAGALEQMGKYNTGLDSYVSNISDSFFTELKDRGIIAWTWTYSAYNDVKTAQKKGYVGLTTNAPSSYQNEIKSVAIANGEINNDVKVGDEVQMQITAYDGNISFSAGEIVCVQNSGRTIKAVARVNVDGYVYYSHSEKLTVSNVAVIIAVVAVGVVIAAGCVIAVVLIRKKRKV